MLSRLVCRNGLREHNSWEISWHIGFARWKACLMKIEQTAHQLETNAHANFPMAENAAYQCMENGGGNMPTLTFLWLSVSGTMLRQS